MWCLQSGGTGEFDEVEQKKRGTNYYQEKHMKG